MAVPRDWPQRWVSGRSSGERGRNWDWLSASRNLWLNDYLLTDFQEGRS